MNNETRINNAIKASTSIKHILEYLEANGHKVDQFEGAMLAQAMLAASQAIIDLLSEVEL